jgi:hypothetical protein
MFGYDNIDWTTQCEYCLKAINTTHCAKNDSFIKKLIDMKNEYRGNVSFECEFFVIDKLKLKENENK